MLKKSSLLLFFASVLCLYAQDAPENFLEPSDFSQGLCGWHGDGTPSNALSANNLAGQPSGPVTLDIALSATHWTRIYQDFRTKYPSLNILVQYKVSDDLAFSDKIDDYLNFTHGIGYDYWPARNADLGAWVLLLTDVSRHQMLLHTFTPHAGNGLTQTAQAKFKINTQGETRTLTLAFPPGQGTVSLLNATATPDEPKK